MSLHLFLLRNTTPFTNPLYSEFELHITADPYEIPKSFPTNDTLNRKQHEPTLGNLYDEVMQYFNQEAKSDALADQENVYEEIGLYVNHNTDTASDVYDDIEVHNIASKPTAEDIYEDIQWEFVAYNLHT